MSVFSNSQPAISRRTVSRNIYQQMGVGEPADGYCPHREARCFSKGFSAAGWQSGRLKESLLGLDPAKGTEVAGLSARRSAAFGKPPEDRWATKTSHGSSPAEVFVKTFQGCVTIIVGLTVVIWVQALPSHAQIPAPAKAA